jgi:hypothetical protein
LVEVAGGAEGRFPALRGRRSELLRRVCERRASVRHQHSRPLELVRRPHNPDLVLRRNRTVPSFVVLDRERTFDGLSGPEIEDRALRPRKVDGLAGSVVNRPHDDLTHAGTVPPPRPVSPVSRGPLNPNEHHRYRRTATPRLWRPLCCGTSCGVRTGVSCSTTGAGRSPHSTRSFALGNGSRDLHMTALSYEARWKVKIQPCGFTIGPANADGRPS